MKMEHFHSVKWNSRHQLQPIWWHDFHFPKRLTQLGKTVYPLLLFASFLSRSICYLLQEIQILSSRLCHMCKGKSRSWFPIYNSTFPVMLHSLNSFWLKKRKRCVSFSKLLQLCSWLQPLASRYMRVKMFMDLLFLFRVAWTKSCSLAAAKCLHQLHWHFLSSSEQLGWWACPSVQHPSTPRSSHSLE